MRLVYTFKVYSLGTIWCFDFYEQKFDKTFYIDLQKKILKKLTDFDKNYSRFQKNNVLDILNTKKEIKNPPPDLLKMLIFSQKIFDLSDGNFDISLAKELEKKGYDKTFEKIEKAETAENKKSYKNERVENFINFNKELTPSKYGFDFDEDTKKIVLNKDKKIDLGGLGKGYLVDKITRFLKKEKVLNFSINAGGDIFTTHKRKYYLQSPFQKDKFIGEIEISNSAIAASNSLYRNWQKNNKIENHFVQKSSFKNKVVGVYTQAKDCLLADSIATALFVSPVDIQLKLYQNLNFEFMLVFKDGSFFKSKNYLANIY